MKGISHNLIKLGLFYSALVPFFDALNMLALYMIIPLVFLYCLTRYKVYYGNRYIVILSLFITWILFSCVTTNYWELTLFELKAFFGTMLLCYIVSSLSLDKKNIPFLYSLWTVYYIGMLLYIPQMDVFKNFDYSKDRLNDGQLNANTIAYHTFYLTFVLYIFGEIIKNKKKRDWWQYAFFITIPLSLGAALITGSRQVLLIQIPLIFSLISIRYAGKMKYAKLFIMTIIVLAITSIFVVDKASDIFEHSVLATRYEKKLEKDSRTKLLKDAIGVGSEYPILGVGPGNYYAFSYNKHFSHCSYTELFANSGILATLLYLYLLCTFLKHQILYFFKTRDKLFLAFFLFGVFYTIDNFFYVFYTMLWLFPFFFLVASHSEYYYKDLTQKQHESLTTCH